MSKKRASNPPRSTANGQILDLCDPDLLRMIASLSSETADRLRGVQTSIAHASESIPGDPVTSLGLASGDLTLRVLLLNELLSIVPRLWAILFPAGWDEAGFEMVIGGPGHHAVAIRNAITRIVLQWGWLEELRAGRRLGPKRRFDPVNTPVGNELVDLLDRSSRSIREALKDSDTNIRVDTKVDTRKKLRQPESAEIQKLFRLMRARRSGETILDCCRKIVGDDERRAKNLRRQASNYPDYHEAKNAGGK